MSFTAVRALAPALTGLVRPSYNRGSASEIQLVKNFGAPPGCSNSEIQNYVSTLRNLMENGRPRLKTKHGIFVDQFLPASSQGTRPDVGGCLAGAYRHCAHGMLPIRHDFDD